MDQQGLVERARRGDRQAFAELIRASGARLDATARLILRDPELAQDAVQETLIRAWRSLPGLRDPEKGDVIVFIFPGQIKDVEHARDQQLGVGVKFLGKAVTLVVEIAFDLELDRRVFATFEGAFAQLAAEAFLQLVL